MGGNPPGNNGKIPNDNNRPEPPSGNPQNGGNMTPPDDNPPQNMGENRLGDMQGNIENNKATNKEFTISGISNLFSGVAIYSE